MDNKPQADDLKGGDKSFSGFDHALFISEIFIKAGTIWKIIFILAMLSSLTVAILICPDKNTQED